MTTMLESTRSELPNHVFSTFDVDSTPLNLYGLSVIRTSDMEAVFGTANRDSTLPRADVCTSPIEASAAEPRSEPVVWCHVRKTILETVLGNMGSRAHVLATSFETGPWYPFAEQPRAQWFLVSDYTKRAELWQRMLDLLRDASPAYPCPWGGAGWPPSIGPACPSAPVMESETSAEDDEDELFLSGDIRLGIPPEQVLRTIHVRVNVSSLPRAEPRMWFPSDDELDGGDLE